MSDEKNKAASLVGCQPADGKPAFSSASTARARTLAIFRWRQEDAPIRMREHLRREVESMAGRAPLPDLLEFLSVYDNHVVELALAVRARVLVEAPAAMETIYDAYNAAAVGYSFTGRLKEGLGHLAIYSGHVNLEFN
jgi:hypothetical protein